MIDSVSDAAVSVAETMMPILLHGTTRQRALKIMQAGPDPNFREPNGADIADGFSTCFEQGPFDVVGRPEVYACGKAKQFPAESGPALLAVDVPDEIIDLAKDALFPRSQGIVQFDIGKGLQELRDSWSKLRKEIRPVECP